MAFWILKTEPASYGWSELVGDGGTEWDGIRNPAARLHLKAMQSGDTGLLYHSGKEKAGVGLVTITRAWRPDGEDGAWASVAIAPLRALARPVTLAAMKAAPPLGELEMLRQSRLSVSPVNEEQWAALMELAGG